MLFKPQYKLLKIAPNSQTAQPVDHIEKGKPAIFILGGSTSTAAPYEEQIDTQYLAKMPSFLNKDINCNYYTIQKPPYFWEGFTTQDYFNNPETFAPPAMQIFADKFLLKNIPNITKMEGKQRKETIEAVKTQFSSLMAIGYSEGAEIIQEIVNSINKTLEKKGFTLEETKECVEYFSAGTIGNPAILTSKFSNASQFHTLLARDEAVKISSKNKNHLTLHDPNPHAYINYADYGKNNLAIVSTLLTPQEDDELFTYASKREIHPTKFTESNKLKSFASQSTHTENIANTITSPSVNWATKIVKRQPADRHHDLYLNANIDRMARPDLYTYGFNPGAIVFWEGMKRMIENMQTGHGNEGYQPPATIVEQIRTEFLSREGKRKVMEKVHASIAAYQSDAEGINQPISPGRS